MSLNGILDLLEYHPEFSRAVESVENHGAETATVRQGARPAFIASLARRRKGPLLVITPRPEDARRLHDHLLSWLGDDAPVHLLPEPEVLPFERLAVDANTGNQRLATLAALAQAPCSGIEQSEARECDKVNPVVVSSIGSALLYTAPPELMAGRLMSARPSTGSGWTDACVWRVGDRVRIDDVLSQWLELGYRHEPVVESPGSFSHRGGILDIFPPDCDLPLRIELFDDEIDTIRRFDPLTQRSVGAAEEVRPIPAREQLPSMAGAETLATRAAAMDFSRCGVEVRERIEEELETLACSDNPEVLSFYSGLVNRACLLDYLDPSTGPGGASVLLERGGRVEAEASELEERLERMRTAREERGELPANFPSPFVAWTEFAARLGQFQPLDLQAWVGEEDDPVFLPATPYYGRLEQLSADLRRRQGDGAALVAVTQHARRVAEILEQQGVGVSVQEGLEEALSPGQVSIIPGSLPGGWTVELPPSNSPLRGGKEGG